VTAQSEIELIGVVRAPDQSGLAGVAVKVIGGDFRTTGNSGEFRIPISKDKVGKLVTFQVHKGGWVVADPRDLVQRMPADPAQDPVRITMKPLSKLPAPKVAGKAGVKLLDRPAISSELTQANKLMDVATILKGRGIYDESLKKYQAALVIARQSKFQEVEMECLSQIGKLQITLGEYAQAKDSFKLSQTLAAELHSPSHFNWVWLF